MANLSAIIAPTNLVTATSTTTLSNKTLVAPALGTPVSGNLSNCTGIPSPSAATPTALGTVYGKQTTSGGTPYLTAIGYNAGLATTGVGCTAVGVGALTTNSSGANHTAIGYRALLNSTVNDNSTAVGFESMLTTTTGNECTALGYRSLYSQDSGYFNTAIGVQAAYNLTSGTSVTAVGHKALFTNGIGEGNTGLGFNALYSNSTASNNTAVGYQAAYSSTAADNSAFGYKALYANTTGVESVAIGHLAGTAATTGGYNVFVGKSAGSAVTTSTSGVFIGGYCGTNNTTGSRNTYIGYGLSGSSASVTDEIVITSGSGGTGKGGSTGFINPSTGGVYQGNNSTLWSVTSDQRLKKNIVDNNIGLEKLTQIQVRNFEYRLPEEVTDLPQDQAIKKLGIQLGVIAQELQQILPECVKTESTGVMSVDADNLTWYMINAIKELKAEFDAYKASHP